MFPDQMVVSSKRFRVDESLRGVSGKINLPSRKSNTELLVERRKKPVWMLVAK